MFPVSVLGRGRGRLKAYFFDDIITRDEQLPGGMVVTLAHTELGVRKGETAATVTDALNCHGTFHLVSKISKEQLKSTMKSADMFAIKEEMEIQEQA